MIVTLQTQRVRTLGQLWRVAEGNEPVDFTFADRASAYEFIGRTLASPERPRRASRPGGNQVPPAGRSAATRRTLSSQ